MEVLLLLLSLPLMLGAGLALDGMSAEAEGDHTPAAASRTAGDEDDAGMAAEDAASPKADLAAVRSAEGEQADSPAGRPEELPAPWAMGAEDEPDPAEPAVAQPGAKAADAEAADDGRLAPVGIADYRPGSDRILIDRESFNAAETARLVMEPGADGVLGRLVDAASGLDQPVLLLHGMALADVRPEDFVLTATGA